MDKPEMITEVIENFNIWDSSFDPSFIEISHRSRVPYKWISYKRISQDEYYANSILKPINKYVERLYPAPKLISIGNGEVRLRQYSHAEVFILVTEDTQKFLDRPWMRQFYKTSELFAKDEECFDNVFLAYTPWIIDLNTSCRFEIPKEESAFKIFEIDKQFYEIPKSSEFVEPMMIPFRFKKVGKHMLDQEFGKVKRFSAIYDIVLPQNDIIEERVKEFYA